MIGEKGKSKAHAFYDRASHVRHRSGSSSSASYYRSRHAILDEHGIEHDPEHCHFRTVTPLKHQESDSGSETSDTDRSDDDDDLSFSSSNPGRIHHHHHHHPNVRLTHHHYCCQRHRQRLGSSSSSSRLSSDPQFLPPPTTSCPSTNLPSPRLTTPRIGLPLNQSSTGFYNPGSKSYRARAGSSSSRLSSELGIGTNRPTYRRPSLPIRDQLNRSPLTPPPAHHLITDPSSALPTILNGDEDGLEEMPLTKLWLRSGGNVRVFSDEQQKVRKPSGGEVVSRGHKPIKGIRRSYELFKLDWVIGIMRTRKRVAKVFNKHP